MGLERTSSKKRRVFFFFLVSALAGYLIIFFGIGIYGFPNQPKYEVNIGEKQISVLGSNIRYRDIEGEGVPVIFIHGNKLSLDDWDETISHLEEGQRLIALDVIGFAGSDRPDLPYDIECHRKYIIAFMDALEISKAILVGHSMGGTIAAWIAAKSNDRVKGVVMVQLPGVPGSLHYRWPKGWICKPGLLNRFAFMIADSSLFKYVFPMNVARQTLGVTGSYTNDFSNALYDIDQPALLLMARNDEKALFEYVPVYQERIENLTFQELPPVARHMAPSNYPKGLAMMIQDFLNKSELVGF